MENLIIRKPKREEYEEIVGVLLSEKALWNESVFSDEELKMLEVGKDNVDYLVKGESTRKYLIAVLDGKIVGFLSWRTTANNVGWVSQSATLAEYYRRGVGRALNQEVEKQAKEMGLSAIMKETQRKAKWAVQFHLANGYKILSQKETEEAPFKGALSKPIPEATYVFGKKAEDFCK